MNICLLSILQSVLQTIEKRIVLVIANINSFVFLALRISLVTKSNIIIWKYPDSFSTLLFEMFYSSIQLKDHHE